MIGRVAAVDYGRRRIGLAVCDALGITVRGLPTLVRRDGVDPVPEVARVLREEGVVHVLVGLPLHADGRASEMSAEATAFGEALARAVGRPVEYVDEGLTSWAAEETLKGRGRSLEAARRSGEIDQTAAVGLLRGWLLDREARPPAPEADGGPPTGSRG